MESDKVLIAQYTNRVHYRRNKIAEATIDKLLSIIFPDFNKVSFNEPYDPSRDQRTVKSYVTTKLFDALQKMHNTLRVKKVNDIVLPLPSKFLPTLCNYQIKSVVWLLERETIPETILQFFERLEAKDGETVVYKHSYSRYIQSEPPRSVTLPPGGILADEMGLGKTVEVLALILLNQRNEKETHPLLDKDNNAVVSKRKCLETKVFCICTSESKKNLVECSKCNLWQHLACVNKYRDENDDDLSHPYICPNCWRHVIEEYGLIKGKATLIVSPNTIKQQWLTEIRRHIQPSLRVFVYDGVAACKWICPCILAEYDVVLTDYNVLRPEVYYTSENLTERTTRNKRRSIRMQSPLLMIEWWRVCLDEAQMVESNTSKVSNLVRMIPGMYIIANNVNYYFDGLIPHLK